MFVVVWRRVLTTTELHNVCCSLEKCLDDDRAAAERMERNLNCDIKDLQEDLTEAKNQVAFLQKYKLGYDELQSGITTNAMITFCLVLRNI